MGNSNDLYVNSILLAPFLLVDADMDPHAAAKFPDVAYE